MQFELSSKIYQASMEQMELLSNDLKKITQRAGMGNPKFEAAWGKLFNKLKNVQFSSYRIEDRFDLRALSVALTGGTQLRTNITIRESLLDDADVVAKKPSTLFVDALFQYFLSDFDKLDSPDIVGIWLQSKRQALGINGKYDELLLCSTGPKTMALNAIKESVEFKHQINRAELQNYSSGDFIKRASQIYYVEQIKKIPANQPHPLLTEIAKEEVAGARYDEDSLVGHIALNTLIERAPQQNVHESWQNAILAIAGDPRIPSSNPRYIKWWSHVPINLIKKVRGWLSKLDLKLFLEALEDYSKSSRDEDMMRMFPSRKSFLEGMHKAGAILHTKLYLSRRAEYYIKRNYQKEHIPDYSVIQNGDRSIIYAELSRGHMIEGSHNCKIWFYRDLPEHAFVRQFQKQRMSYEDLTSGLSIHMSNDGYPPHGHFTHHPSNFNWQRKSIKALQEIGVKIRAADVLSSEDYGRYKRIHGVD